MQLVYDSPSGVDAVVGGDINKRGKQVGHSVLPGSSIQSDLLRSQTVVSERGWGSNEMRGN